MAKTLSRAQLIAPSQAIEINEDHAALQPQIAYIWAAMALGKGRRRAICTPVSQSRLLTTQPRCEPRSRRGSEINRIPAPSNPMRACAFQQGWQSFPGVEA